MSLTIREVAEQLHSVNKKVHLIYAFNGSGKTRLSREFKDLVSPRNSDEADEGDSNPPPLKILYYNAFTEDLFYWDNDLQDDVAPKLKIQPNNFTDWVLRDQGQDQNVITIFQRYTSEKLTPQFNAEYLKDENDPETKVEAFSEVSFSFERGNEDQEDHIKLSKGEESNFIWSVFYSILDQVIETLNILEESDRDTAQFDHLEYVFIDDPVSSLDENHLIQLAVDTAKLIKRSHSELKFLITTHNPLFYNVLCNEFNNDRGESSWRRKKFHKYRLEKHEDGTCSLEIQPNDSPFSYHLFLKSELEAAIESGQIRKYHFNFLRNILEKTSTFLGYNKWEDLLPQNDDGLPSPYEARMINFGGHSKHAGEEVAELTDDDKRVLKFLVKTINETYHFQTNPTNSNPQTDSSS